MVTQEWVKYEQFPAVLVIIIFPQTEGENKHEDRPQQHTECAKYFLLQQDTQWKLFAWIINYISSQIL